MTSNPYEPSKTRTPNVSQTRTLRVIWILLSLGVIVALFGLLESVRGTFVNRGMPRRYATYVVESDMPLSGLTLTILAIAAIGISILIVVSIVRFCRRNDDS